MAPLHLRDKVEFATIHSLLGLSAEIDSEGHETFKPIRDVTRASFAAFDIVLIDESSMINAELWGLQEAMARYTDVKVILWGTRRSYLQWIRKSRPYSPKSATHCLTQIVRYVAENQSVN